MVVTFSVVHLYLPPQQSLCVACWPYCNMATRKRCNGCCAGAACGGLRVAPCHVDLFFLRRFICQNQHAGPYTMATRQWQKRNMSMMTRCGSLLLTAAPFNGKELVWLRSDDNRKMVKFSGGDALASADTNGPRPHNRRRRACRGCLGGGTGVLGLPPLPSHVAWGHFR